MKDATQGKEGQSPLLPEFEPVSYLWENGYCPSEQSARWTLRQYRDALVEAKAIASLRGRLMVHPGRFRAVIEAKAFLAVLTFDSSRSSAKTGAIIDSITGGSK